MDVAANSKDWQDFHEILRTSLFHQTHEEYSTAPYYPNPHTLRRTNLLLKAGTTSVAAATLDELGEGRAVIRGVAVVEDHQRQGLGRILLEQVQALARQRGNVALHVNAGPDAVGFYRRAGFVPHDWDLNESKDCPNWNLTQMSMALTPIAPCSHLAPRPN